MRISIFFISLFVLCSCSPMFRHAVRKDLALKEGAENKYREVYSQAIEEENRLYKAALPLLQAAEPFSAKKLYTIGVLLKDSVDYSGYSGVDELATPAFSVRPSVRVQFVHEGFSGYLFGLRENDEVLAVNGQPVDGVNAEQVSEMLHKALQQDKRIMIKVRRGKQEDTVEIPADRIAGYEVVFTLADLPLIYSSNKKIYVSEGMLKVIRPYEHGLSYLLSFEIGQMVLEHFWWKTGRMSVGAIADMIAMMTTGVPTFGLFGKLGEGWQTKDAIEDADFVSLYLLKVARIPIDSTPIFWREMQAKCPVYLRVDLLTFPPTPEERYQSLKKNISEMNRRWSLLQDG